MRVGNQNRPRICDVLRKSKPIRRENVVGPVYLYQGHEYLIDYLMVSGYPPKINYIGGISSPGIDHASAIGHFRSRHRWPVPLMSHPVRILPQKIHGELIYATHRPRSRHIHKQPRKQGRKWRAAQVKDLIQRGVDPYTARAAIRAWHRLPSNG